MHGAAGGQGGPCLHLLTSKSMTPKASSAMLLMPSALTENCWFPPDTWCEDNRRVWGGVKQGTHPPSQTTAGCHWMSPH